MREGRGSRTAQQNALFRALEAARPAAERVSDDTLAKHFLPLEFRVLVEAARVPPVRRAVEAFIDRRWPGPRAGQLVRTSFIDERVEKAASQVGQVLVLGAGFDTRAFRLGSLASLPVFEVDHPSTQAIKERAIARLKHRRANITFVGVDFVRDDLSERLERSGFVRRLTTLVLWEGVTNYLTADAVRETFTSIAALTGSGSPVLFTYIDRALLDGTRTFEGAAESSRAVRNVGEPYTFGLDPAVVRTYLSPLGFELISDDPVSELAPRYYGDRRVPKVYSYYHVVEARRT